MAYILYFVKDSSGIIKCFDPKGKCKREMVTLAYEEHVEIIRYIMSFIRLDPEF